MSFHEFRKDFERGFAAMPLTNNKLFVVDLPNDAIWNAYIESFPEEGGIRQRFNCDACRGFLKRYGKVVGLNEHYGIVSAWNFETSAEYQPLVDKIRRIVEAAPIKEIFLTSINKLGIDTNIEILEDAAKTHVRRYHFFSAIPNYPLTSESLIATENSLYNSKRGTLYRTLNELKPSALETVLDLIESNGLYRGSEFRSLIYSVQTLQEQFVEVPANRMINFTWATIAKIGTNTPVANLLGTSIGTLLSDVSEGVALENAVRKFENVVAGPNYKRPNAVVTTKMVQEAQDTFQKEGLLPSLARRHATKTDIPVSEVFYVNRDTLASTDVFEIMKENVLVNPRNVGRCQELSFEQFRNAVIPKATSIQLLFEESQKANLFNMTTAVNADSPSLFKWDNQFSWSYVNSMTDSIKERVKAAGGNIVADVRISLSWHNYDDLDLRVKEPNGNNIYYGNKRSTTTDGELDVDMQAGGGTTRQPVENITYRNKAKMTPGKYVVQVNNFAKRENTDTGYEIELEIDNVVYTHEVKKNPGYRKTDTVITLEVDKAKNVKLLTELKSEVRSTNIWGLDTNKWQKVSMIVPSPNHWDGKEIGNKHYFLILEGAKNPESTRSIYNEYVNESLNVHKRAFEMLGSKTLVPTSDSQLAGVGFSSTRNEVAIFNVDGKLYKVKFN